MHSSEINLAVLLGRWFAENLGRQPTRAEIGVVLHELAAMPTSSIEDVEAAMRTAGYRLGLTEVRVPR